MQYTYKTQGTCSQQIVIDLDGDIITNVLELSKLEAGNITLKKKDINLGNVSIGIGDVPSKGDENALSIKKRQKEIEEDTAKKIEEYIKNQLQDDIAYDQLTLKEYIDPFTGKPVTDGKK